MGVVPLFQERRGQLQEKGNQAVDIASLEQVGHRPRPVSSAAGRRKLPARAVPAGHRSPGGFQAAANGGLLQESPMIGRQAVDHLFFQILLRVSGESSRRPRGSTMHRAEDGVAGQGQRGYGTGPTRLISPRSTFQSWGNSSRLVRRSHCPTGFRRGSRCSFM